ncbi:MAG: HEAT repeat domain-containing protein [Allomuricauda sp.]|nr:MAG: HEAT repeat domain-containing protein [Allomuricauda sp.]
MKKEEFETWAIDFLSDGLDEKERTAFANYLKNNAEAEADFQALKASWAMLDKLSVPETTEAMDARFFGFLNSEVEKTTKKKANGLNTLLQILFKPQLAYGILLLGIGLAAGYFLNVKDDRPVMENTVVNNQETEEVREKLVLTLLEQPSANKRLQGVNEVAKMDGATDRITNALFVTLNNDSNVNVRLASVELLSKYVANPNVRMGLIQSIAQQDSPIVQIALADLMVALQEKESIKSMEQLLNKPDIDTTVSKKLKESINQII